MFLFSVPAEAANLTVSGVVKSVVAMADASNKDQANITIEVKGNLQDDWGFHVFKGGVDGKDVWANDYGARKTSDVSTFFQILLIGKSAQNQKELPGNSELAEVHYDIIQSFKDCKQKALTSLALNKEFVINISNRKDSSSILVYHPENSGPFWALDNFRLLLEGAATGKTKATIFCSVRE